MYVEMILCNFEATENKIIIDVYYTQFTISENGKIIHIFRYFYFQCEACRCIVSRNALFTFTQTTLSNTRMGTKRKQNYKMRMKQFINFAILQFTTNKLCFMIQKSMLKNKLSRIMCDSNNTDIKLVKSCCQLFKK